MISTHQKDSDILGKHIPFIVYGLDDEAQSWADSVDILTHDLLHNGGLACIVQAPALKVSILFV